MPKKRGNLDMTHPKKQIKFEKLERQILDFTFDAMNSIKDYIVRGEEDQPEYELLMCHLICGLKYFQRKRQDKNK